jgi:polyisoprenoid-binding protein YceI
MPSTADRATRKPTPRTPTALSGSWRVDPRASHARFLAGTLGGLMKTPGRFRSLSGDLIVGEDDASGVLVIESSSIDTGNGMRDRHLRSRDFFHVKRHPHVRYEARSVFIQDPGRARIDGELVVVGTRTPLPLDVTLHAPADGVVELACQTQVDRVVLGVKGARGMVPRTVHLDLLITLRQTSE